MAKKKKNESKDEQGNGEKPKALGGDAKRGIIAVLLLALAILFLLSFIGQAGSFGKLIDAGAGLTVGWSRWLLIPILPLLSYLIIRRHTTSLSDVIKYIGLSTSFLAFLGLSHLFLGTSSKALLVAANAGQGGGMIGYFLASGLDGAMGKIAAFVVLFAFFVTGVIAAFNVSLLHWIERILARFKKPEEGSEEGVGAIQTMPLEDKALSLESALDPVTSSSVAETVPDNNVSTPEEPQATNVQNIRFAEKEEVEDVDPQGGAESPDEDETVLVPAFIRPKKRRTAYRWDLPPLELLASSDGKGGGGDIELNKEIIIRTLRHFHIEVEPGEVFIGPTVTQYTFRPAVGVKISRITTLHNDLALALAAHHIRIEFLENRSLVSRDRKSVV